VRYAESAAGAPVTGSGSAGNSRRLSSQPSLASYNCTAVPGPGIPPRWDYRAQRDLAYQGRVLEPVAPGWRDGRAKTEMVTPRWRDGPGRDISKGRPGWAHIRAEPMMATPLLTRGRHAAPVG